MQQESTKIRNNGSPIPLGVMPCRYDRLVLLSEKFRFEGGVLNLIVSVSDDCLSIYLEILFDKKETENRLILFKL